MKMICAVAAATLIGMISCNAMSFSNNNTYSEQSFYPRQTAGNWFVTLGGGGDAVFFGNQANDLVVTNTMGPPADTFTMNNSQSMGGLITAAVGYRFQATTRTAVSAFLEYDYLMHETMDGSRLVIGPPNITSDFSYNLGRQAVLLGVKDALTLWQQWMPYIEAGFGMSFNTFSDYVNNTSPSIAIPPFPNNTTTQLAAVVGVGIDWAATRDWMLSAGYRFGYWGDLQSGEISSVEGSPLPSPVNLTYTAYSNEIMLKASYIIRA